ncbi:MAG TPA: argininosuccinate synthase domain-containing protein [Thermoanaerobaculia bacterium]|jgi:argininosuccinate synthase|nr:argininosuccinate synthase domain-containing protein [Thermoanaerobaculia bacterium]
MSDPIVLAFSGGLDTSFCIPFLGETLGRPVITVTVDTGGLDAAARESLAARARALGAAEHVLVDARAAYFDKVLRFLVMGNVRRGQVYPLCVGAERVIQAQEVARAAARLGTRAVAHGCTAAGNDQVRFDVALRTLDPGLEVIAPVRDQPRPRAEQVAFLEERGLPVPSFGAAYSINRGLWGVTIGGRETLGSAESIPESAWVLTRGAFEGPGGAARPAERHTLGFVHGVPVSFDGAELAPPELIERVEASAAAFGIGRGIHLGETILGIKGRVAFEAPAAEVLINAHRELEKLTLTGRQIRMKETAAMVYGDLVHEGQHLDPVCRDIEALLLSSQERVTGTVKLLFRTGQVFVEGIESPHSLLAATKGIYGEAAGEWTAADARGFSRIAALPGLLHARASGGAS